MVAAMVVGSGGAVLGEGAGEGAGAGIRDALGKEVEVCVNPTSEGRSSHIGLGWDQPKEEFREKPNQARTRRERPEQSKSEIYKKNRHPREIPFCPHDPARSSHRLSTNRQLIGWHPDYIVA